MTIQHAILGALLLTSPRAAQQPGCLPKIENRDWVNGSGFPQCFKASQVARYHHLYPLTEKFFVEEATGEIGIGTITPAATLHVTTTNNHTRSILEAAGLTHGEANLRWKTASDPDGWEIFMDDFSLNNLGAYDQLGFWKTGFGAVMVLDGSTGRVGIGTATPEKRLDVRGSMRVGDGSSFEEDINFRSGSGDWQVGTNGAGNGTLGNHFYIYDSFASAHRLTVQRGTGNVGIGTASPSQRLHVEGNICYTGMSTGCSDERFKTNVVELEDALAAVGKLRGVRFDWKREEFPEHGFSDRRQVGFLAQEVAEVLPEVVAQGSDGYLSIDYGKVTPILAEAVQELSAELDGLRSRLAERDADLGALRERVARLEGVESEIEGLKSELARLAR